MSELTDLSYTSSAADIAARLRGCMADLARELYGEENKAQSLQSQLRFGNKGSLAVDIAGEKAGTFYDHEDGAGGDALVLVKHKLGLSTKEAFAWAKSWLGIEKPKGRPKDNRTPVEKVAAVVETSHAQIEGTPVDRYLKRRGITATLPDCIRFRPNAYGKYGAMVAFSTDDEGKVLAVHQVYLTDDGQKAPLETVKRTNRAVDGWTEKANVRFPGKEPIILAEGVETALSLWQATGQETRACLGISNIAKAPLPQGATIVVARDGDELGSKADNQIQRVIARLQKRSYCVALAAPPVGKDFNDILVEQGEDAVREAIANASIIVADDDHATERSLFIGSDVEIAKRIREELTGKYGFVLYAEGDFWRYGKTHWEPISDKELHANVHDYDGAIYETPRGEPVRVKLNSGRIESTLKVLIYLLKEPDFFANPQLGINCASGFIRFFKNGDHVLETHHRDHRHRHTLHGHWSPDTSAAPPKGSLFYQLLEGSFKNDEDKEDKKKLVAEVFGSAALGVATRLPSPKAAVFKGETADNGKSAFVDIARGSLPASAICAMSASRMGDERYIVGLAGKLMNGCDELSSAAISSDKFKAIVTGEPVEGRDVYKSRVEFRPVAQHIFATNTLPPFHGGMDRGVQRRLIVVTFNRVISDGEKVEEIGRRITREEADLVLAWVVEGAARLLRQRKFTEPSSSKDALRDWIMGADPVIAWLMECVEIVPEVNGFPTPITTRSAFNEFNEWAIREGFKKDKLPAINGFVQRVKANAGNGLETKRTAESRYFHGLFLRRKASDDL